MSNRGWAWSFLAISATCLVASMVAGYPSVGGGLIAAAGTVAALAGLAFAMRWKKELGL